MLYEVITGYLMIAIPIFSIMLSLLTIIIMSILNKIKKLPFSTDFQILGILFLINIVITI